MAWVISDQMSRPPSSVRSRATARPSSLSCETERSLVGVLVTEAAGVSEQSRVQVGSDVGGDRCADGGQQAMHHLPGGAGPGIDEVDGAERLVADVMVDVHDRRGGADEVLLVAEALHRRAVEGE